MYASTFTQILHDKYPAVGKHFQGDYAFDKYPRDLAPRNFILWNSSSELPGEHWRVVYRHPDINIVDLFDPLGLTSEKVKSLSLKFIPEAQIEFNVTPVQKLTSNSCGYFCLYFAVHRIINADLSIRQLITEDFSPSDLDRNLTVIKDFFKHNGIILPTD